MAELKTKTRDKLPDSAFAEPDKRAYPVEDKAHARNAKARASQAQKAGRMSKAEEAKIDRKADKGAEQGLTRATVPSTSASVRPSVRSLDARHAAA